MRRIGAAYRSLEGAPLKMTLQVRRQWALLVLLKFTANRSCVMRVTLGSLLRHFLFNVPEARTAPEAGDDGEGVGEGEEEGSPFQPRSVQKMQEDWEENLQYQENIMHAHRTAPEVM